jgi:hypothetical protein
LWVLGPDQFWVDPRSSNPNFKMLGKRGKKQKLKKIEPDLNQNWNKNWN